MKENLSPPLEFSSIDYSQPIDPSSIDWESLSTEALKAWRDFLVIPEAGGVPLFVTHGALYDGICKLIFDRTGERPTGGSPQSSAGFYRKLDTGKHIQMAPGATRGPESLIEMFRDDVREPGAVRIIDPGSLNHETLKKIQEEG